MAKKFKELGGIEAQSIVLETIQRIEIRYTHEQAEAIKKFVEDGDYQVRYSMPYKGNRLMLVEKEIA